jgi:DNA-binding NarL/FixJ family response regulator
MNKINVCIVDDHNLYRKAMVRLLKTFKRVDQVFEVQHGKELVQLLTKEVPDVVLLDLEMPVMNGVETAEFLLPKYPDIKVIVLTQHDSEKFMLHMLEMGVHSFLLKNANPDELEKAILSVYDKDFYHNDLISAVMRKSISLKAEKPLFSKIAALSDREKEVFKLICEEYSLKEISARLNISDKTTHSHKANIQAKLGAKNTVGMIKFAYENGLLK